MIYVDAELFLGVMKSQDHLKERARLFFFKHPKEELVTSTIALLEVWFYFYKHETPGADQAIRASKELVSQVIEFDYLLLDTALYLGKEYGLSPADACHASIAIQLDAIATTDQAFKKIPNLNVIDF